MHDLKVGQMIHGYAGGTYGRDSYYCRRVEAVGYDWVVTRNSRGVVEVASGQDDLAEVAKHAGGECNGECSFG